MLARPSSHRRQRHPLARDSEITVDDETMEKAIAFLKERLSPEDLSELKQMLAQSETPEEEGASDEPPPFKDQPKTKTDGTMLAGDASSDANLKRYAEWFPDAMRIKQAW